jgi:hypothetical protein
MMQMPGGAMGSLAFDEFGRPFMIMRDEMEVEAKVGGQMEDSMLVKGVIVDKDFSPTLRCRSS